MSKRLTLKPSTRRFPVSCATATSKSPLALSHTSSPVTSIISTSVPSRTTSSLPYGRSNTTSVPTVKRNSPSSRWRATTSPHGAKAAEPLSPTAKCFAGNVIEEKEVNKDYAHFIQNKRVILIKKRKII